MRISERSTFVQPKENQLRNQARRAACTSLCRWVCQNPSFVTEASLALELFEANAIQDYSDDFDGEETFLVSGPDGAFLAGRSFCQCDPTNERQQCRHSLAVALYLGYQSHYTRLSFEARQEERRQSGELLSLIKGEMNHVACPTCEDTISIEVSVHTEALSWMLECENCGCEFECELVAASQGDHPTSSPLEGETAKTASLENTPTPHISDLAGELYPADEIEAQETPENELPPRNPISGVRRWRWKAGRLQPKPRKIRDDQAQLGAVTDEHHVRNWRAAELSELGPPVSLELH
jgi:hypothetical protein